MRLGAHVSAAGGLWNAPVNAAKLGLECFQFFSRPPQGGRVPAITPEEAGRFLRACEESDMGAWYIHAPYVINLASKEERIRNSSIEIIRGELERGSILHTRAMMFHPGSASGVGEEEGIRLVIAGIKEILSGYEGSTLLLVEISAGAGMVIGDTFEEVAAILAGAGDERVKICFDTAHAFASGYDLSSVPAVELTMKKFDQTIGADKLLISHCNDSKVGLGERKDRHEHIGRGQIGRSGFEAIVASPFFRDVDLILETPVEQVEADVALMKKIRETCHAA